MLRVVIIEDEKLIASELEKKLTSLPMQVEVTKILGSVKESIDYFSTHSHPDLVFSDIQLCDGLSFTIFDKLELEVPVVFITGFDSFVLNAFEHNGIDYLLKPVEEKDLIKVLNKYKNFEKHFVQRRNLRSLFERRRERMVLKKGFSSILLKIADIVMFYTENKVVYAIDKEGRKYMSEQNLFDLESLLDDHTFFRANRQYIINIGYVKSYRAFERVKLSVDLSYQEVNHSVVVSQETAPFFRKWISEG